MARAHNTQRDMAHVFKPEPGGALGGKENIIPRKIFRNTHDISRSILPTLPIRTATTKRQLAPEKEHTMISSKKHAADHDSVQTKSKKDTCDAFTLEHELMHSLRLERELMPAPDYFHTIQKNITEENRSIAVRYQIRCAYELQMSSAATFMSVAYLDRFLSAYPLDRRYMSMLCAVSLYVASKFEDTLDKQFDLSLLMEVCEFGDKARQTILHLEGKLLKTLNYRLCQPTSKSFLVFFFKNSGMFDDKTYYFALFMAQIFQTDCACLKYMPSLIGKLVGWISINTCNKVEWCHNQYLTSQVAELRSSDVAKYCIRDLQRSIEYEKKNEANDSEIILRFASNAYLNVADINTDSIHFDI